MREHTQREISFFCGWLKQKGRETYSRILRLQLELENEEFASSLHTFVVSIVSINKMTNERDALQTFLNSHNLSHLFQNLVEFGIDSLDALKYERDLKGLCEDIGAMDVDAERLERARKSLSEEENAEKREPQKLKTTNAKEAIEQAKLAMKARTENVSTSDGQRKLRESLLEKQSGGVGVGERHQHGKIEKQLTKHIEPFTREEVERMLEQCKKKMFFAIFKLPKAPVDDLTGKCEWRGHPATSGNAVLLESKMVQMRLMKTKEVDESLGDACERCTEDIKELTRVFSDRKLRDSILKREVERRVEELIAEGNEDLAGGFVTVTGIHYGTGAAAAAAKHAEEEDFSDVYDGEGPRALRFPGARLPPSANEDGLDKIDRLYRDLETNKTTTNSRKIEDEETKGNNTDSGVDLEAIRNKLKRKKPKFM